MTMEYSKRKEFEINEEIGRKKAVRALNNISKKFKIHLQEDLYSRYDIDLKGKTDYIVECKDRDYDLGDWEWYVLEIDKYNALMNINKNAIYLNTFKDGKYCLWFLNEVIDENARIERKEMWHNTTLQDYKIMKDVYALTPDQAKYQGYCEENDTHKLQMELLRKIRNEIELTN